ncbi:YHS domain-containing protein, partial [Candidatus Parcubacteria bacterium]
MAKDPVCGMEVNPDSAAGSVTYKGETYYSDTKPPTPLKRSPVSGTLDEDGNFAGDVTVQVQRTFLEQAAYFGNEKCSTDRSNVQNKCVAPDGCT